MRDQKYVYHGSERFHDKAVPVRHRRRRRQKDGTAITIFDRDSFHATLHKWIAVAYTYTPVQYDIGGKIAHYNMGVDLYNHEKKLEIHGFESLEKSLEVLYGSGGYISSFYADDFHYTQGLGDLEVITTKELTATQVEYVENPLDFLKKEGVEFEYIDLSKSENESLRNYQK
tara:strand:+ start:832 stop:1347 length:516 start_codon:yes stop_codon:yes gene_type:complete